MRNKLLHHLLLSAYGGCLIGAVEGQAMAPMRSAVLRESVVLWAPWGAVCGLATWPLLRTRPRWATPAVLSAGVVGAGAAALLDASIWGVLGIPLLTQLGLAAYGRRYWPAERGPGDCQRCGYDLRGLTIRRCPECGCEFEGPLTSATSSPGGGHSESPGEAHCDQLRR